MTQGNVEPTVLALEHRGLDQWSQGHPTGHADLVADDGTYFDDIGAHRRIEGGAAIRAYLATLKGRIPPHRYEIVDPRVQAYGDVAVLTLRYQPRAADGSRSRPGRPRRCTDAPGPTGAWCTPTGPW